MTTGRSIMGWSLAAVLVAAGAARGRAAEPEPAGSDWTEASAAARARANPYEGERDAVRAGGKQFARYCASCHGEQGRGGRHAPTLRAHTIRSATPGELFWFLTNGDLRSGMPAWSRLPEARRWQIVAFLKTIHDGAAQGTKGEAK